MKRDLVQQRKKERDRFASLIKEFRKRKGWSLAEMARAMKVDNVQSVQQWEAGDYVANARHLAKLAKVMGVHLIQVTDWIYGEEAEK